MAPSIRAASPSSVAAGARAVLMLLHSVNGRVVNRRACVDDIFFRTGLHIERVDAARHVVIPIRL
jgi:hypothetical protein